MPASGAPDLVQIEIEGIAVRAGEVTPESVEAILRQHVMARLPSGPSSPDQPQPDLARLAGQLAPLLSEAGVRLVGPRSVMLRAVGSRRVLRFEIGTAEADAVAIYRQRVPVPRPMSHDLMKSLLDATGTRVERVVITLALLLREPGQRPQRRTEARQSGRERVHLVSLRRSSAPREMWRRRPAPTQVWPATSVGAPSAPSDP